MKIALIDNYDSFVYNLRHMLLSLGAEVSIFRNDAYCLDDLIPFDKIIFSPGPGLPSEAGLLLPTVARFASEKPMLGVCLGHQAIAECFGGRLVNLDQVFHGVRSDVSLMPGGDYIFDGLGGTIPVGRYHSWVVDESCFPDCLEVTALSREGQIMALRHRVYDVHGIQFHPESVLTPDGAAIISAFINHH